MIDRLSGAHASARHRALGYGLVAALLLLIALPASVHAGTSLLGDTAAAWPSSWSPYLAITVGGAGPQPTTDPDAIPQTDTEDSRDAAQGSPSSLLLLALVTATIFILAVAYDSRRRDDQPW